MDLLIPENWLKSWLETKATATDIAKYLSLCGPSIERINKVDGVNVFDVEVTTNRVDSASVYGIAREALTILPRFGIKASLKKIPVLPKNYKLAKKVKYLNATVDSRLCPRFTAVLVRDVKIKDSSKEIQQLLKLVGVRAINNVVDVSNFIMHELGQPVHTFDYDKIKNNKMILRSAKKGEKVTTLDGKEHKLLSGDIVIEDGSGKLIDLCGIMGGANSQIDSNTKNVLLFVQTYNPSNIRQTSMRLSTRSEAAVLFEKGLDTELVLTAMAAAIELFEMETGGKVEKEILDVYPNPYKTKVVNVTKKQIESSIGIALTNQEIISPLINLGFEVKTNKNNFEIKVPSYRARDIEVKEDVAEEVARIYGYHNLPSVLMKGSLPEKRNDTTFEVEDKIKDILVGLGAVEVYTLSLVPESWANNSLALKNPLGSDSSNLRTSLIDSLTNAMDQNKGEKENFVMYEIANIYNPRKNDLPDEVMTAAVITNHDFISGKGIAEILLKELGVKCKFEESEMEKFAVSSHLDIKVRGEQVGQMGILESGYFYLELTVEKLNQHVNNVRPIKAPSKFPPQIEDMTATFPEKTAIGDVIESIKNLSKLITDVELKETYNQNYTFRIWYQDENKTLTDNEVEVVRNKIAKELGSRFGADFN